MQALSFSRCILNDQWDPFCFLTGEALKSRLSGRAVGPAVRQSPLPALPRRRRQPLSTAPGLSAAPELFAFGEAPAGGGLGSLGDNLGV